MAASPVSIKVIALSTTLNLERATSIANCFKSPCSAADIASLLTGAIISPDVPPLRASPAVVRVEKGNFPLPGSTWLHPVPVNPSQHSPNHPSSSSRVDSDGRKQGTRNRVAQRWRFVQFKSLQAAVRLRISIEILENMNYSKIRQAVNCFSFI
jgi:hypothetical protein